MGNDFLKIKLNEICEGVLSELLDYRMAMIMFNAIASTIRTYSDRNILIDQTDISFHSGNYDEIFDVLENVDSLHISFTNKVANVIPNDPNRFKLAKLVQTALHLPDDKFKIFTDYDDAVSWLAD